MDDRTVLRKRLEEKLRRCIQFGRIRLSSGKETDFYFDGRLVSLDPEGSVLIAELMLDEIGKSERVDAVGGLTSGADPLTSSIGVLAHQRGIPLKLFYVRKEAKTHGMGKQIEGPPLPRGARALVVDDVITTGKSILLARDALREAGAEPVGALAIVDREEGGRQTLEREGLRVAALFRKSDFLA
ncbi:MAG: orotate phosphoribosyltransferase [Thermoanaerobaculia bacterium]